MGAATRVLRRGCRQDQISIHAAPWEPRLFCRWYWRKTGIFHPRGSVGAATIRHQRPNDPQVHFNPRGSVGAATRSAGHCVGPDTISSTRLRGSRDSSGWCPAPGSGYFNPRGSVGAATKFRSYQSGCCSISIHAAPWEPRRDRERKHRQRIRISIHAAPWEPRRPAASAITTTASFQSTRLRGSRDLHPPVGWWRQTYFNPRGSVGAATKWAARRTKWQGISIHAARGSRDTSSLSTQSTLNAFFNPRGSVGAATRVLHGRIKDSEFPIHAAPWEPRPAGGAVCLDLDRISIHAAPWEPRRRCSTWQTSTSKFQSTRLRGSRDSKKQRGTGSARQIRHPAQ